MFKASFKRFPRALARLGNRKIETATLALFAAASAVGIARKDGPASSLAALTTKAAAAVVAPLPAADTKASTNNRTTDLAMIAHPRVDSWVKRFTTDLRGSMTVSLDRMTRYEQMISSE